MKVLKTHLLIVIVMVIGIHQCVYSLSPKSNNLKDEKYNFYSFVKNKFEYGKGYDEFLKNINTPPQLYTKGSDVNKAYELSYDDFTIGSDKAELHEKLIMPLLYCLFKLSLTNDKSDIKINTQSNIQVTYYNGQTIEFSSFQSSNYIDSSHKYNGTRMYTIDNKSNGFNMSFNLSMIREILNNSYKVENFQDLRIIYLIFFVNRENTEIKKMLIKNMVIDLIARVNIHLKLNNFEAISKELDNIYQYFSIYQTGNFEIMCKMEKAYWNLKDSINKKNPETQQKLIELTLETFETISHQCFLSIFLDLDEVIKAQLGFPSSV